MDNDLYKKTIEQSIVLDLLDTDNSGTSGSNSPPAGDFNTNVPAITSETGPYS